MVTRRVGSGFCISAVLALPLVASGFQNEQRGFERLRFGQSVADVRAIYPNARQLGREELGAVVVYSPFIVRHQIRDVRLDGLAHPISLELRFWKEKLWVIIGYFGDNSTDEIIRWLNQRYGRPTSTKPDPAWSGKIATVTMSSKQKWFSVADAVASKEISTLLIESMKTHKVPAAPPQLTPVPTPFSTAPR